MLICYIVPPPSPDTQFQHRGLSGPSADRVPRCSLRGSRHHEDKKYPHDRVGAVQDKALVLLPLP